MQSFLYNGLAIFFALASALTLAWGTVVRHRIAKSAPDDGSLKGSPLVRAISDPLWWAGTGTALLGYGLQLIALGFGTLLVVQPILVLSLMFTLPLAARYDNRRISKSQMAWAALLTVAVAVLVILGKPAPGDPQPPFSRWVGPLVVGVLGVVVVFRLAYRLLRGSRALVLGLVTGAIFGYVAVFSKSVVDIAVHALIPQVLVSWQFYALIAGAALGTAVQQYSFSAGPLKNSLPAMTIGEPITAFTLGYLILGEQFQVNSVLGWLAMGTALVAMILATVALSRSSVER
nr:DMT family transporter [Corynebacterium atypicum]